MDSDTNDVVPWAPSPLTRFPFRAFRPLFFFFVLPQLFPSTGKSRCPGSALTCPGPGPGSWVPLGCFNALVTCHSLHGSFFSQLLFCTSVFFLAPLLPSSLVQLFLQQVSISHGSLTPECIPLGLFSCRSRAPPCLNSPAGTALVRGGGGLRAKPRAPFQFVCYPVPYRVCLCMPNGHRQPASR